MSGSVTAACCSCGPIPVRRRRWYSTPTTGRLPYSRAPAARHLRQHEDGGGDGLRRQGSPLQSLLPADVQPLHCRAGRLHAGIRLGEGPGREPGRACPRALLHATAAVHAYADRIVIRQDGRIVAEHPRSFSRSDTVYDPWHYVPVLARKPGALRDGAPFKDWVLPAAMERVRRKLASVEDGNRQMVNILTAVLSD